MTTDQVAAILGPADSATRPPDGVETWQWTRREMHWRVSAPAESTYAERVATVEFERGQVIAVTYANRVTR